LKFEIDSNVPYTNIIKHKLASCEVCGSLTRWFDDELKITCCSLECNWGLWRQILSDDPELTFKKRHEIYADQIRLETETIHSYKENPSKAILIVAHNQHDYLEKCLKSIKRYTDNYKIYLWDNASNPSIQEAEFKSNENLGFIKPNNEMAKIASEDVIICLNSDTEVRLGWDRALCAYLNYYEQVGFLGCYLDENLFGNVVGFGNKVDYVLGWGFAIKKETYLKYGLFDEKLEFAYFEDADLSLSIKNNYALYSPLVHHYGNKTVVLNEKVLSYIKKNYFYFKDKWKTFKSSNVFLKDNIWGSAGKKIDIEKK